MKKNHILHATQKLLMERDADTVLQIKQQKYASVFLFKIVTISAMNATDIYFFLLSYACKEQK